MGVQEPRYYCKCRDIGVEGWIDRFSLLWSLAVGVCVVHFVLEAFDSMNMRVRFTLSPLTGEAGLPLIQCTMEFAIGML
ncbi:hypothetical protein J6590_069982, partial [Homalodisca vitripennis]